MMIRKIALLLVVLCTPVFTASTQEMTGTVAIKGAQLFDRPSVIGERRADVPVGTAVKILDADKEWYIVRIGDAVGWMRGATLSVEESPAGARGLPSTALGLGKIDKAPPVRMPSTGRVYIRGPRGGCYYINGSGNKTYVDHSFCR